MINDDLIKSVCRMPITYKGKVILFWLLANGPSTMQEIQKNVGVTSENTETHTRRTMDYLISRDLIHETHAGRRGIVHHFSAKVYS